MVAALSMPVTMAQLLIFFLASVAISQPGSPLELTWPEPKAGKVMKIVVQGYDASSFFDGVLKPSCSCVRL